MHTAAPGASREYSYGGVAYHNPDAVTQVAALLDASVFAKSMHIYPTLLDTFMTGEKCVLVA